MIEDMLIVDYDPFAMESRISICQNGMRSYASAHSSIEDLSASILKLAYENNLYVVKVRGPFGVERKISELVQNYEKNQYDINKIEVGGLAL